MHLTTLFSLLAVGAAAAPVAAPDLRSTDLGGKIPYPTELPKLWESSKVERRQEAEEPSASSASSEEPASTGEASFRDVTEEQDAVAAEEPKAEEKVTEAEPSALDDYLATLNGEYDSVKSDAALDLYDESLDPEESTVTTSTSTSAAPVAETPVPDVVEEQAAAEPTTEVSTETEAAPTAAVEDKAAAEKPVDEETTAEKPLDEETTDEETTDEETTDEETTDEKPVDEETTAEETTAEKPVDEETTAEKPVDEETTAEKSLVEDSAVKNETTSATTTTSAVPVATKAASSDPLAKLSGLIPLKKRQQLPKVDGLPDLSTETLPIKRQELHDLPKMPTLDNLNSPIKRQFYDFNQNTVVKKDDTATPEESTTTPAVEEATTPTPSVAEQASSSSTVSDAAAETSDSASDGFHGINKHMEALKKLPIGLRVKRSGQEHATVESSAEPAAHDQGSAAPSDVASAQPTGAQPTESEFDTKATSGSPLDKFLVSLQREYGQPAAAASSMPADESSAPGGLTGEQPTAPASSSDEPSPVAALTGEAPSAPEAAGGPPSGSESAPVESSDAPASPLAGLTK